MLRTVIDTNVIVSGLIKPDSTPELILMMILETRHVRPCLSDDIFSEYKRVPGYGKFRKYLDQKKVGKFLSQFREKSIWVKPEQKLDVIKNDPDDNRFLECALAAQAHYLITGNTKHFQFKNFRKTRIISPGDFLTVFLEKFS
ncbi:MAG: putative toxin-antitoxin system toxin component, PIN family [Desulfococcaceae bacterium]